MSDTVNLTINLDTPCKRCGEKGATQSGDCLRCVTDWIVNGREWPPLKRKKKR